MRYPEALIQHNEIHIREARQWESEMFILSERSIQRRQGVDLRLIDICDLALKISIIDFGISGDGGMRTAERQNELFLDGKSKCDGYKNQSKHQRGMALDFYAYVDGKASWDELHLAMVGAAFLQAASNLHFRLKWGGLFKPNGWDKCHVELY